MKPTSARINRVSRIAARRPRPPITAAQVAAMPSQKRAERLVDLFASAAETEGKPWSQDERLRYIAEVAVIFETQASEETGIRSWPSHTRYALLCEQRLAQV